jgi:hypothetical protein
MSTVTKQPPLVRDLETVEPRVELMPAPIAPASDMMAVIERVASNPDADIAKLERLIELKRTIDADRAKAEFNAAFALMQPKIPVIVERGQTDKGSFAELEDIIEAVRPILADYGFAISHKTEWPSAAQVRVLGILRYRTGHQETSEFLSAADTSGSKNAIQALASAVSYGRRYTTKDLLCIVTRKEDDDGQRSEQFKKPDAPSGFDDWQTDMQAVADEGIARLTEAFNKSKDEYKKHLLKHFPKEWATLKNRAGKVKA